jgi:energy-coupling factor transport system substrate-specific component
MPRLVLLAALAAAGAAVAWTVLQPDEAGLPLLLVAAALVVALAAWLEAGPGSAREVALVAVLGAAAAAGRVLFAPVPGVQPVTVIAVATGSALGLRAGVAVGATAALVSNVFLGQGPWTPWQMLGWATCGAVGAVLAPLLRRRILFALVCGLLGLGFSAFMDLWYWFAFWPHTWQAFLTVEARGLPYSAAHAIGNVLIALAVGPELRRLLARYGRRLRTTVAWA